jgi:hypothetical protein
MSGVVERRFLLVTINENKQDTIHGVFTCYTDARTAWDGEITEAERKRTYITALPQNEYVNTETYNEIMQDIDLTFSRP